MTHAAGSAAAATGVALSDARVHDRVTVNHVEVGIREKRTNALSPSLSLSLRPLPRIPLSVSSLHCWSQIKNPSAAWWRGLASSATHLPITLRGGETSALELTAGSPLPSPAGTSLWRAGGRAITTDRPGDCNTCASWTAADREKLPAADPTERYSVDRHAIECPTENVAAVSCFLFTWLRVIMVKIQLLHLASRWNLINTTRGHSRGLKNSLCTVTSNLVQNTTVDLTTSQSFVT